MPVQQQLNENTKLTALVQNATNKQNAQNLHALLNKYVLLITVHQL